MAEKNGTVKGHLCFARRIDRCKSGPICGRLEIVLPMVANEEFKYNFEAKVAGAKHKISLWVAADQQTGQVGIQTSRGFVTASLEREDNTLHHRPFRYTFGNQAPDGTQLGGRFVSGYFFWVEFL